MPGIPAIDYWFTESERGIDLRTGAVARLSERPRTQKDRPGKTDTVWDWFVKIGGKAIAAGTRSKQIGARASVRAVVRKLPDKASAPIERDPDGQN